MSRLSDRWRGRNECRAGTIRFRGRLLFALATALLSLVCRFTFTSVEPKSDTRAYGRAASAVAQGRPESGPRQWFEVTEGISGMARLPSKDPQSSPRYLVVHDRKRDSTGPRIGLIELRDGRPQYSPVPLELPADTDRPSDLESVCQLPGREMEFLLAESSRSDPGPPGRIFQVKLRDGAGSAAKAELIREHPLPSQLKARNPEKKGEAWDQIEGMACYLHDGQIHVILGERMNGDLYTAVFAEDAMRFTRINGQGPPKGFDRAIAELHFDADNARLLAVATSENEEAPSGELWPFASVIYTLADVDGGSVSMSRPTVLWTVEGFKVEALAGTPWPERPLCFGTEDEQLGGCWRLLRPSRTDRPR